MRAGGRAGWCLQSKERQSASVAADPEQTSISKKLGLRPKPPPWPCASQQVGQEKLMVIFLTPAALNKLQHFTQLTLV